MCAVRRVLPIVLLVLTGCEERPPPHDPAPNGALGAWRAGLSVAEAGGCSTGVLRGLSQQLIDEVNCLRPNTLADF